jgi:O-antigen/teichoic acid export membrane protein
MMKRQVVITLAGLLTVPLISRRLGSEGLGAWALVGTSSFLLSLSDLGLTTVVHRATALKSEPERARRAVGLTVLAILVVGPCLALVFFPLLLTLPGASAALLGDMASAMMVAFPAGILGSLGSPYRGFALVHGAVAGLARARTLAALAQVAVTAVGLRLAPTLVAPAAGVLASTLLETMMMARLARRIDPQLPLGPRLPSSLREAGEALRGGAATLTLNVIITAGTRADILILARAGSLVVVTAYSIASRAVDLCFVLAKQTSTAMVPRLLDVASRGRAVMIGTRILGALGASGLTALATCGQPFLVAWAGPTAGGHVTAYALGVLGLAMTLAATSEVAASALTLGGRTAWAGTVPIVAGYLVNILISVAGVARFGIWAVAGGTLCGNVIVGALVWPRARRLLGWTWGDVGRAFLPVMAAWAASLGAGLSLQRSFEPAASAAGSVLACALTTAFGCSVALAASLAVPPRWRADPDQDRPGHGAEPGSAYSAR